MHHDHPNARRPKGPSVLAICLLSPLLLFTVAQAQVEVEFWHAFTGVNAELLEGYVADFNESQDEYQVNPSFRGSYPETMVAAISAFRAGNAPHIVQMFEVGTATMMAAGEAILPVHQLFEQTGVAFDPEIYLPAVRSYYSLPDGRMMSMPFNSSTAVMWINEDAFRDAGLDPEVQLETWDDVRAAATAIVEADAATCGFSMAWPTWTQYEQFSAIHDVPFATRANGFEGLDAELMINSDLHVRHLQTLIDMQADGAFTYGGRDAAGDALFPSGECAILQGSSGLLARVLREAEFDWSVQMLPHYDDVEGAPLNSVIGGASFWVMQAPGRTDEEYTAVANFFNYLARPEVIRDWHLQSGNLPIVFGVFDELQAEGYYDENPGRDIPYEQLTRATPTENSRGFRLGNLPEIRNIIQEEIERAFQGEQGAQQALDTAVERGNAVLRAFERANR
ncbi:MAG: sn-glycerol-3-phosphate ABC transporter substrate-binding protein UgpB [Trueperaceae bacterium]|nr:sn-glycerol-3-phosphate ABC transporter substrate-binding protein UgpB [Trueperaceae bacterium]